MRNLLPLVTIPTLGLLLLYSLDGSRADQKCSKKDIAVTQRATGHRPNGMPIYSVEIANLCAARCPISNIRLSCGAFSSPTVINPKLFKRIAIDACLVNNAFSYPLAVKSANIPG